MASTSCGVDISVFGRVETTASAYDPTTKMDLHEISDYFVNLPDRPYA